MTETYKIIDGAQYAIKKTCASETYKIIDGVQYAIKKTCASAALVVGDIPRFLVLPKKIDGKPLTRIEGGVFQNNSTLSSISIPDTVKSIGKSAFSGSRLCSITLPKKLKRIHSHAFARSDISCISIPESVTHIEDSAFSYCKELKTVVFETNAINKIPSHAFAGCINLTNIKIPQNVKLIGQFAFRNCSNLQKVIIPSSVQEIHTMAFAYTSIEDVCLPQYMRFISTSVFENCHNLKVVNLPSTQFHHYRELFTQDTSPDVTFNGTFKDFSTEYRDSLTRNEDGFTVSTKVVCSDGTFFY